MKQIEVTAMTKAAAKATAQGNASPIQQSPQPLFQSRVADAREMSKTDQSRRS
jgi:hypothetical protein